MQCVAFFLCGQLNEIRLFNGFIPVLLGILLCYFREHFVARHLVNCNQGFGPRRSAAISSLGRVFLPQLSCQHRSIAPDTDGLRADPLIVQRPLGHSALIKPNPLRGLSAGLSNTSYLDLAFKAVMFSASVVNTAPLRSDRHQQRTNHSTVSLTGTPPTTPVPSFLHLCVCVNGQLFHCRVY